MKWIILISITFSAQANESVSGCLEKGYNLSAHKGYPKSCFPVVRERALAENTHVEEMIKIYAFKNILLKDVVKEKTGKKTTETFINSGLKSELHDIQKIYYSTAKKMILAINKDSIGQLELLQFPLKSNGNVIPSKVISLGNIEAVDQVFFHPNGNDLILLADEKVLAYKWDMDERQVQEKFKPRQVEGLFENVSVPKKAYMSREYFIVFDQELGSINFFPIEGNISPKADRVIPKESLQGLDIQDLSYDEKTAELSILFQSGEKQKISLK